MAMIRDIKIDMEELTEKKWRKILKRVEKRVSEAEVERVRRNRPYVTSQDAEAIASHNEFLERYRAILANRNAMVESEASAWGVYSMFGIPPAEYEDDDDDDDDDDLETEDR